MTNKKENTTNRINRDVLADCNLTYAVQLMGGRWKLPVITRLSSGKKRFGELRSIIPNITERMLALQLRQLEQDGLIKRTVYNETPPRVEYELTTVGSALIPVCLQLHEWGARHKDLQSGIASHENP